MFRIGDRSSGLRGRRSGLQFMRDARCPISSPNGNCLFWSRSSLWTTITHALIKGGCCSWHVVIRFRPKCLTKWRRSSPTEQHLICFYWASQSFMFDKVSACTPSTLSPEEKKNKYCLPLCLPLTAAATSSERWAARCWEVSTGCFFCYKLQLPQASPLNNSSTEKKPNLNLW